MTIKYHPDVIQGSEQWAAMRCGLLTASEMELIITPKTLKYSESKDTCAHMDELLAQRITQYVEPQYISDGMLRGMDDEIDAKILYNKHYAPLKDVGFVTNDKWGFTLGYSPDGLVADDGLIEVKGRKQKFQVRTIIDDTMPDDFRIQVQTGMLISEREWCDFISYSGGMLMFTKRVYPDKEVQEAIIKAATSFHEKMDKALKQYTDKIAAQGARLIPTERRIQQDMII